MSKESVAIGTIGVRTKEVSENGGTSGRVGFIFETIKPSDYGFAHIKGSAIPSCSWRIATPEETDEFFKYNKTKTNINQFKCAKPRDLFSIKLIGTIMLNRYKSLCKEYNFPYNPKWHIGNGYYGVAILPNSGAMVTKVFPEPFGEKIGTVRGLERYFIAINNKTRGKNEEIRLPEEDSGCPPRGGSITASRARQTTVKGGYTGNAVTCKPVRERVESSEIRGNIITK